MEAEVLNLKPVESVIFSPSLAPAVVAQVLVSQLKESPRQKEIVQAKKYFDIHSDIEKKTRVYYDRDRHPIENPAASNVKIKSAFLRQLVQQKQDYSLAKTFIIKLSNEKEQEIDLAKDDYGKAWKDFCDDVLFKQTHRLCGRAVNDGIAWCYLWIDGEGKLMMKNVPAELVYPVWHESQHESLERLVYNFRRLKYDSASPSEIEYADYWTDTEHYLFDVSNGYKAEQNVFDDDGNPLFSHMTGGVSWGRVPFVCFKGTDDEMPLLNLVKSQIDEYENVFSKGIDGINDDLDPIMVVKEMSSELSDILETKELMKLTRFVSLSPDGDARYVSSDTNIEKYLVTLERLRKDIYKFGYGVDTQDARFGGNPNQLEIKSLYQDMDTYVDGLERHFQNFVDGIKYFFDKWWEFTGKGSFDIAQSYNVRVKFDRSMLINQSSLIDDTVKLQNTGVSQKTLLEFNPVVQDVEQELERLEEERKEAEKNNPFLGLPEQPEGDGQPEESDKQTEEQKKNGEKDGD